MVDGDIVIVYVISIDLIVLFIFFKEVSFVVVKRVKVCENKNYIEVDVFYKKIIVLGYRFVCFYYRNYIEL